jgi:hypothetical protein
MSIIHLNSSWLVPLDQLSEAQSHLPQDQFDSIKIVGEWAQNYLCEPHPSLGRDGVVCPFVKLTIQKKQMWLNVLSPSEIEQATLTTTLRDYKNWLLELEPTDSSNKVMLLVMPFFRPEVHFDNVIASLQELDAELVEQFVSIGTFFPNNAAPGMRNPEFRQFYSPIPLFVIRSTTVHDFPFIMRRTNKQMRLNQYFSKFAPDIPKNVREEIVSVLADKKVNKIS